MSNVPPPLVPPEVDLRDFSFMPVDIVRLFNSEFHARSTDAEWRAGFTLWLKSYHQVPASSLPDDDVALARLAEFGRDVKGWLKVKTGALRGWSQCSDGRRYHRVVSEKALEGWIEKLVQRKSSGAGNAKRYGTSFDPIQFDEQIEESRRCLSALNPQSRILAKRCGKSPAGSPDGSPGGSAVGTPGSSPNAHPHGIPDRTPDDLLSGSQGTGTSKGQGKKKEDICPKQVRTRHAYTLEFLEFWDAYPTDANMGKREAFDEWLKLGDDERRLALASCPSFVRHCKADPTYRPIHANRYLAKRRFEGHAEAQTEAERAEKRFDFGGGISAPYSTIRSLRNRGTWLGQWGPTPDEPNCRVTPETMKEIMNESAAAA